MTWAPCPHGVRTRGKKSADATTGLHKVPYYWAGVFVLEAARFLFPAQHCAH